jgi:predicted  nucleic acid-binding Zn-ribbon protein
MSIEDKLSEELADLKRIRDEIRVQIHLGKAEAKELWEQSEHKIEEVELKMKSISDQAEQPLSDIRDAAKLLLDEISDGYKRIRDAL